MTRPLAANKSKEMNRQDAKNAKEDKELINFLILCLPWRSWRLGGSFLEKL